MRGSATRANVGSRPSAHNGFDAFRRTVKLRATSAISSRPSICDTLGQRAGAPDGHARCRRSGVARKAAERVAKQPAATAIAIKPMRIAARCDLWTYVGSCRNSQRPSSAAEDSRIPMAAARQRNDGTVDRHGPSPTAASRRSSAAYSAMSTCAACQRQRGLLFAVGRGRRSRSVGGKDDSLHGRRDVARCGRVARTAPGRRHYRDDWRSSIPVNQWRGRWSHCWCQLRPTHAARPTQRAVRLPRCGATSRWPTRTLRPRGRFQMPKATPLLRVAVAGVGGAHQSPIVRAVRRVKVIIGAEFQPTTRSSDRPWL